MIKAKLDQVWNLVKAINASDQIEQQKKTCEQESEKLKQRGDQTSIRQGNRSNIDASKLINRDRSEMTIYEVEPFLGQPENNKTQESFSSPEAVSSDDAISPIEFSESTKDPGASRMK